MKRYRAPSIVVDRFNRADGNLGSADSGQAWLTNGAATDIWVVSSNHAKALSALPSNFTYIDCGRSNVDVSADIRFGGYSNPSALVARMSGDSISNCMYAAANRGTNENVSIRKTIAGVTTYLATASFTINIDQTYSFVFGCKGDDFTLSINGTAVLTVADDNVLKSNTKVGMLLSLSGSAAFDYFDNFTVKG